MPWTCSRLINFSAIAASKYGMTRLRHLIDLVALFEASMATLYHHAPKSERASIQRHGLLRSKSPAHGIFFASKATDQVRWGIDTWKVDVRGLQLERDTTTDPEDAADTWWVTYDEDISPDRLTLIRGGKTNLHVGEEGE